jgi:O-antigen/teichoic acid export membrane protein
MLISRLWGAELAGVFTSASATALLLAVISDWGYDIILPRSVAALDEQEFFAQISSLIGESQSLKLLLWMLLMLVLLVYAGFHGLVSSPHIMALQGEFSQLHFFQLLLPVLPFVLYSLWVVPRNASMTFSAILRARLDVAPLVRIENTLTVLMYGVCCGLVIAVAHSNILSEHLFSSIDSLPNPFSTLSISALIMLILAAEWVKMVWYRAALERHCAERGSILHIPTLWQCFGGVGRLFASPESRTRLSTILRSENLLLMILQALSTLEARSGIYILSLLSTQSAVGYFAAALRFLTLLRILPGVMLTTLIPLFAQHRSQTSSRTSSDASDATHRDERSLWRMLAVLVAGGAVVSLVVSVSSSVLTATVYGMAFAPAAPVLAVLAWLFVVYLCTYSLEAYLLAHKCESAVNAGLMFYIVLLVGCSVLGMPFVGTLAVAYSMLAAQIGMTCWYALAAWRVGRTTNKHLCQDVTSKRLE